ncbi:glycosyltransferase [Micrococcales bacterium 31B]|nr:glycosyltransferase [Micrococcales bacterium 31B]
MTSRRLILFTNDYPNPQGDFPFVNNEIDALCARFDDVVIFSQRPRADSTETPTQVHEIHSLATSGVQWIRRACRALGGPRRRAQARALWRVLREERPRIRSLGNAKVLARALVLGLGVAGDARVHAALDHPDVTVYHFWGLGPAFAVPFLPPVPTSVRLHRFDLYEDDAYLPLRTSVFRGAAKILVVSEQGAEHVAARHPEVRDRLVVSRLGSHDYGVSTAPEPDLLTVVSCSSLTGVKRVPLLAQVLATLAADRDVRWVHFGEGPERDLVEALLPDAPSTLHADLRGYRPNAEVIAYLRDEPASVFVNVSTSEGIPVSLMEALSFGVPIVATAVGGVPELFSSTVNLGTLLDPAATMETIAAALVATPQTAAPRSAIRQFWADAYNAPTNAAAAADVIAAIATPGKGTP